MPKVSAELYAELQANCTPNTEVHYPRFYTAKEIASLVGVSDAAIRNRWYPWLCKACPERLLKTREGFTEKAFSLFQDYRDRVSVQRSLSQAEWVEDVQSKNAHEWSQEKPEAPKDRVPEGSRLTLRTISAMAPKSNLLDEVIDVEYEEVDTTAIDIQTGELDLLADDLVEAFEGKVLSKARSVGKTLGAKVKNTISREIAQAYRDLV